MTDHASSNQKLIITHAVLAGLTPLIPIPLVDDLVKTYFVRSLMRKLYVSHGYSSSQDDIKLLAAEAETGCLRGCMTTAFFLPFKLVFRKIFFFLEWKRAVDTVSHVYYQGYLVECAVAEGWCEPAGPRTAAEVRAGVDAVLQRLNTSLIERAVSETFNQSKAGLKSAATMLERTLRRTGRPTSVEQLTEAVEAVEEQEEREIEGIAGQLQNAIARIPAEHFERLRRELAAQLGRVTSGE